jgi:sphingomyelin phosphodiesterase
MNPSFRIYEIDADTNEIIDTKTYFTNLKNAANWNESGPVWELEYSAREAYKVCIFKVVFGRGF